MKKLLKIGITCALLSAMLGTSALAADPLTSHGLVGADTATNVEVKYLTKDSADSVNATTLDPTEASEADVANFHEGTERVELTYTNVKNGSEYLIFTLNDGTSIPTANNIVYIDQQTAADGKVTFTIYPSLLDSRKDYDIYIASNDGVLNEAKEIFTFNQYTDFRYGDVNNDGLVDYRDALKVLRINAKLEEASGNQYKSGNVMQTDDIMDYRDALQILRYNAKLESVLIKR